MVIILQPAKKHVSYCAINRIQMINGLPTNTSEEIEMDEDHFTVDAFNDNNIGMENTDFDYDEFDAHFENIVGKSKHSA